MRAATEDIISDSRRAFKTGAALVQGTNATFYGTTKGGSAGDACSGVALWATKRLREAFSQPVSAAQVPCHLGITLRHLVAYFQMRLLSSLA
jgi:hypothetical protein